MLINEVASYVQVSRWTRWLPAPCKYISKQNSTMGLKRYWRSIPIFMHLQLHKFVDYGNIGSFSIFIGIIFSCFCQEQLSCLSIH